MEQNDIEAVEALVCMSSWGQRSLKGDLSKVRPLTPVSDSGDVTTTVHVDDAAPELPKDFHSLSTLVRGGAEESFCAACTLNNCAEDLVGRFTGMLASKFTASPRGGPKGETSFVFWKYVLSIDRR